MSDTKKPEPAAKRTPSEWMSRLGKYALTRKIGKSPRRKIPHWQHAAADALHGWSQHQHDADAEMLLSQADYEGALAAVDLPTHDSEGKPIVREHGPLKPHAPAVSPHCKHFARKG